MEAEVPGYQWTVKDFEQVAHSAIFAQGVFVDDSTGFNIQGTGNVVKWVAQKGDVEDWTIYYQNPSLGQLAKDYRWIVGHGDKLHHPIWVRTLVPAEPAMMALYRH